MNFNILRFDRLDSTNLEALRQARKGAEEGTVVVATQQTAGRGRQGRGWISPKDSGLYLTIVLRPKLDTAHLPLISIAASIAVHDTLAGIGVEPDIKWPNDILVGEKKICGILAETTDTSNGLVVVVGIGINLTSGDFSPELADSATSIEDELPASFSRMELESLLLQQFKDFYEQLCRPTGPAEIVEEWSRRSTYANGKSVNVTFSSEAIMGITDGLEPNGALRVRANDGDVKLIHAGDIERLRPSQQN